MRNYPLNLMYCIAESMDIRVADLNLTPVLLTKMVRKKLNAREKSVIELMFNEGKSYTGVTNLTGISEKDVMAMRKGAILKLAAYIDEEVEKADAELKNKYADAVIKLRELRRENLKLRRKLIENNIRCDDIKVESVEDETTDSTSVLDGYDLVNSFPTLSCDLKDDVIDD